MNTDPAIPIVIAVIENAQGQVLLLKRSTDRVLGAGLWGLPAGHVETGELPAVAMQRELREELGDDHSLEQLCCLGPVPDRHYGGRYRAHLFRYCWLHGRVVLNSEHSEYAWVCAADYHRYTVVDGVDEDIYYLGVWPRQALHQDRLPALNGVPLALNCQVLGDGPPLVIIHGLFGAGSNWRPMAARLAERYRVLLPDLRNHGNSPHCERMRYEDMACDIEALLDAQRIDSAVVLGHSMGGKVAMTLALLAPQRVQRLIIADIAPVRYHFEYTAVIAGLKEIQRSAPATRAEADALLAPRIAGPRLRQFLLQNLLATAGGLRLRINIDAIASAMEELLGFPDLDAVTPYKSPARFIHGARSPYLLPEHQSAIIRLFPDSTLVAIPAAGHWLHVEQPDRFLAEVKAFLEGH